MDILILDGLNGVSDIISDFQSVIWTMQYSGLSEFQLAVAGTKENIDRLQPGTYLCRETDRTSTGFKNVMVVETMKLVYDIDTGWILTVGGKGLKSILNKRIVWSQINSSGTVETTIRSAITANVINPSDTDRKISNFVMDTAAGLTDEEEIQLFGEKLGDWIADTCQTYGYGWDIYIDSGKYHFKMYQGMNRTYSQNTVPPVVFSPEYDNLLEFEYNYNSLTFANAALIGGEGEGTSKRSSSIGDATGLERVEAYIDGSGVSSNGEIITLQTYLQMLESFGKEELGSNYKLTADFQGKVDTESTFVFNVDYFLGDIVQVDNNAGISATSRISEIIYCEEADGVSVVPTFSEWEVE